jgi:WD40 repeat protein
LEGESATSQLLKSPSGPESMSPRSKTARSGDALSILSGHGGRILCVKAAWHGDRLLSGGADRTVRVWDLTSSGGKCLNSLSGHFGWVTSVQYWGPNTIVSASTDRSIALWDARVRNSPLFSLRHHYAPISDILVGSRTDPTVISAASDGTVAVWDFRHLSGKDGGMDGDKSNKCRVSRMPAARFYLEDYTSHRQAYGPVILSRGTNRQGRTIFCTGGDAVTREWDILSGDVVSEHATGHCDTVSTFHSMQGDRLCGSELGKEPISGTISSSWDGTIRLRRLVEK